MSAWRLALRLARRDAIRHRGRTISSVLLVSIPVAAMVVGTAVWGTSVQSRTQVLADLPDGVQAVITTTTTQPGAPLPQLPEGEMGMLFSDLEQIPASGDDLVDVLPSSDRLLPYWESPQLLATTAVDLAPGTGSTAEDLVVFAVGATIPATLTEAGGETLELLVAQPSKGHLPADDSEAVVTAALAEQLDLAIGGTLTFVAPPAQGWYSGDGRIGEVIADAQRAFTVSGVVPGDEAKAWARDSWIAPLTQNQPGVDGHWLVVGPDPVTWGDVKATNDLQSITVSRHVLTHYPPDDELYPMPVDPAVALTRVALVIMASSVGAALVFFLLTPAFTVSAEESRRTLGMAAATGATGADLRRIVLAQGVVVGLVGGLIGAGIGTGVAFKVGPAWDPTRDLSSTFPWWMIPVSIGVAVLLGMVATSRPARTASRLQPVEAIRDQPAITRTRSRAESIVRRWAGPALIVAAVVAALVTLQLPVPVRDPLGLSSIPVTWIAGLVLTLALGFVGLTVSVMQVPDLGIRMPGLVLRLAVRDAADHRSRFLPAVGAVTVTVAAASFLAVLDGSFVSNDQNQSGEVVAGGHLALGASVTVSDTFDRQVIQDAIRALSAELPVTGSEQIWSTDLADATQIGVVLPEERTCPSDTYPDTASSLKVGAPLVCTDGDRAYAPGLRVPWWGGSDVLVITGDALRASGFPGTQEAAKVLDEGGVVVNNAAKLSGDGTVRVVLSADPMAETNGERFVELDGAFLRGYAATLAVSPQTAEQLGLTNLVYVGEYPVFSRELNDDEMDLAKRILEDHSLVWVAMPQYTHPWGDDLVLLPLGLLVLLAVLATTVSLILARSQGRRDRLTMAAVGANSGFLRKLGLVQSAVVVGVGVPVGLAAGLGLGVFQVAWNRSLQVDGPWLETFPLWQFQGGIGLLVVVAGLSVGLGLAAPTRGLVRRSLD